MTNVQNSLNGSVNPKTRRNMRKLTDKLQGVLGRLNLPLKVIWAPNDNMFVHGEIKSNVILIYDSCEKDAIETFQHEVYEFKFKEVTRLYRSMFNSLLEVMEKEIYARKEAFFDFLPFFQETMVDIEKEKPLEG